MEKENTIYGRFREITGKYPDAPAIIQDDFTLSFSQLDELVDKILSKFYLRFAIEI